MGRVKSLEAQSAGQRQPEGIDLGNQDSRTGMTRHHRDQHANGAATDHPRKFSRRHRAQPHVVARDRQRLRQRRREEDLQALDVTVTHEENPQEDDTTQDSTTAASSNETDVAKDAIEASGLLEDGELDSDLDSDDIPSEIIWAATPPPGHEAKKRRGLFRKN